MIRGNNGWCTCEAERGEEFFEVVGVFTGGEVNEVDGVQCKGYATWNKHDRDDLLVKREGLCVFFLYPFRSDGVWCKDDDNVLTLSDGVGDGLDPIVTALQVGNIPPGIIACRFEVACQFAGEVYVFT